MARPEHRSQHHGPANSAPPATFAGPVWFMRYLMASLGLLNLGWAIYLILVTKQTLLMSPTWVGALAMTPSHEPVTLGLAFAASAMLILAGMLSWQLDSLSMLGHVVGSATWAALAGSFLFSALGFHGLGVGNALFSAFLAVTHACCAWLRR